ncbi:DUF4291 domain-containing protein [Ferruginibacter sp. SUN106]|uniref:DUF4291 domain-containing protein n=1 Tax=Ferruginibacter sp. SUN106 TaxID=2978348 RepID=UPI003D369FD1
MKTEKYITQKERLPKTGRQIIGCKEDENIIVYQAFNPQIAHYAVANQQFGGNAYSFNRMSWIKPGFLWMMYRAGWATKEQQENILRITLPLIHFKTILQQATFSSFNSDVYATKDSWKAELEKTQVRLQWDPDHDAYGNKQERKAIQVGMKDEILKKFCKEWIVKIEDITDFVKKEHEKVLANKIEEVNVPYEEVIALNDEAIEQRIGIQ